MPLIRPLPLIRRRPTCLRQSSSAPAPAPTSPHKPAAARSPPQPNALPSLDPDSALSRRFTAMAEDALTASPRRAQAIAAENDFPADLKRRLEARLESASISTSTASLPASAPRHARDLAATPPWTGTESTADSVLRMLVDAHKPLPKDLAQKRAPAIQTPHLRPIPHTALTSTAQRIARAKEESTDYALRKTSGGLTDEERVEVRHMLRERFLPAGRAVASFQALASLADEKIEDARRRGQFDNLSNRGKPLERDHNAQSPFLDTTEYLLNRMIKQQDIVPPWIEKQQELASAVRGFRVRVRDGWRRHVARSIASAGGGLEEQCRRAERYARGENRLRRIEERAKRVEMGEEVEDIEDAVMAGPTEVFRDPAWEAVELPYHKLAIEALNSTTRSYNLMAPEPARKPYYSLGRELKSCFRDCAPVIAKEIRDRAVRPNAGSDFRMERNNGPGGLLEKLGGETAVIHDSTEPNYGFKEFWSGLWGKKRQTG
ncbi:hypothetical protein Q9L58_005388 [Maublancomyces gigas]|uniref:DnaJ homologue subfamily C member 28 conserved domain-containing protein n=1 Tax=Discina gigas TaxID=1032678 RepID=A0ABR3GI94_9PEZI